MNKSLIGSHHDSSYFPLNLTFKKLQDKAKYTLISGNGYLGALTGDFIGIHLQVDFLLYNRNKVNLGFGISGQVGAQFWGDIVPAATAYGLVLIGKNESKFEISAGAHFPSYYYKTLPQMIHFGIGYRLVADNVPLTVNVGIATTRFISAGFGIRIGGGGKQKN